MLYLFVGYLSWGQPLGHIFHVWPGTIPNKVYLFAHSRPRFVHPLPYPRKVVFLYKRIIVKCAIFPDKMSLRQFRLAFDIWWNRTLIRTPFKNFPSSFFSWFVDCWGFVYASCLNAVKDLPQNPLWISQWEPAYRWHKASRRMVNTHICYSDLLYSPVGYQTVL